jgi:hypothetical protein
VYGEDRDPYGNTARSMHCQGAVVADTIAAAIRERGGAGR